MADSLGSADVQSELRNLAARFTGKVATDYHSGVLSVFEKAIAETPETGDDQADAAELSRRLFEVLGRADVSAVAESIKDSRVQATLAAVVAATPPGMEDDATIFEGMDL